MKKEFLICCLLVLSSCDEEGSNKDVISFEVQGMLESCYDQDGVINASCDTYLGSYAGKSYSWNVEFPSEEVDINSNPNIGMYEFDEGLYWVSMEFDTVYLDAPVKMFTLWVDRTKPEKYIQIKYQSVSRNFIITFTETIEQTIDSTDIPSLLELSKMNQTVEVHSPKSDVRIYDIAPLLIGLD